MQRWLTIEHKSVPQVQAEQRAALAAQRGRGDVVVIPNGLNGTLAVGVRTDADPSPWAKDLADALRAVETEAECAKAIDRIGDALDLHTITRAESAHLLAAAGAVAADRGWLGPDGRRELEALLRLHREPGA